MSTIYLYNGKILVADGALATTQKCCCNRCRDGNCNYGVSGSTFIDLNGQCVTKPPDSVTGKPCCCANNPWSNGCLVEPYEENNITYYRDWCFTCCDPGFGYNMVYLVAQFVYNGSDGNAPSSVPPTLEKANNIINWLKDNGYDENEIDLVNELCPQPQSDPENPYILFWNRIIVRACCLGSVSEPEDGIYILDPAIDVENSSTFIDSTIGSEIFNIRKCLENPLP